MPVRERERHVSVCCSPETVEHYEFGMCCSAPVSTANVHVRSAFCQSTPSEEMSAADLDRSEVMLGAHKSPNKCRTQGVRAWCRRGRVKLTALREQDFKTGWDSEQGKWIDLPKNMIKARC